jgi:tRNA-guanine family transglycosylase
LTRRRNARGEPPASNETNAKKKTSRRDPVFGFSIGGLGTGEAPGAARASLVAACVAELPREKPVHVAGVGAPLDLIAMIENGVDLMDNAFAHVMTLAGRALRFPVDAKDVEEERERTRRRGRARLRSDDATTPTTTRLNATRRCFPGRTRFP